jgi:curli biogenesis system outer membrane secretion channel CsgG/outer membrane protein OmpA-like peptidoglycan-associated protein
MLSHAETKPQKAAAIPVAFVLTMAALSVSGCTPLFGGATTAFDKVAPGETPVVIGPPVRDNFTPMNPALACLADQIEQSAQPRLTIAVDDIKDYTGQYNINEGNAITQGGSLMVMSALGKLGGAVNVADRFNTDVAQMELSFLNQRELGDGAEHSVGAGPAAKNVPWIPYYGGSIVASRYYITGGITELNYNIQSGGVQFQVNNLGPEDRVYNEDIGIDLELVDTKTLLVVKSVSLVKELTGYEVGFNIFQFFGNSLYNLNIGNKSQEPAQLGVRTLLEEGVLRLVAAAEGLSPEPCLATATGWIPHESAEAYLKADEGPNAPSVPAPQPMVLMAPTAPPARPTGDIADAGAAPNAPSRVAATGTLNADTAAAPLQNGIMQTSANENQIKFDYGATDVNGGDESALDQIESQARRQAVEVVLLAGANESWAPSKRQQLLNGRVAAVTQALKIRGVLHVTIAWEPDPTQAEAVMDDSGYQKVAVLIVSQ